MSRYKYAIITPARNEGLNIENTIKSIINQTIKPQRWVIVNDSSTDNTKEIIEKYALKFDFIKHIELKRDGNSNFSSKVNAFNYGLLSLSELDYDYIGNIDADISFECNYFELLINRFSRDQSLGLCGGMIVENLNGVHRYRKTSENSVAGAVQFFRRCTYEKIGGYIPMRYGGVDAAAEIMVRMNNWEVRTFSDLKVIHNGPVSMGCNNSYSAYFRKGKINCTLGYHPLFHFISSFLRMSCKPFVIGGILMIFGYYAAKIKKIKPQLPRDAVEFLHTEQMARLKRILKWKFGLNDVHQKIIKTTI